MENGVKEIFDENGKELSELLQEWINEEELYICTYQNENKFIRKE